MSMNGRIQYITTVATPRRSPYHQASFYDAAGQPWGDTAAIGDTQDIYLDWGYTTLDPTRKDARTESITPIGFSEIISHGFRKGHKFSLEFVARIRQTGISDDFAVMEALNDHLDAHEVTWWPDYDNFQTETVTVVSGKITPPKRHSTLHYFTFSFDFDELPTGQAPSTVPSFV